MAVHYYSRLQSLLTVRLVPMRSLTPHYAQTYGTHVFNTNSTKITLYSINCITLYKCAHDCVSIPQYYLNTDVWLRVSYSKMDLIEC